MKLSMLSVGKAKKQGDGAFDEPPLALPKPGKEQKDAKGVKERKEEKAGKEGKKGKEGKIVKEEKQGLMARITSGMSLKAKKTKSGRTENGGAPALQLSKSEKELRAAFRVYDADNDGRISNAELSKVLTSLGGEILDEEVQELMKQIDKDKDGFISVEEFIEFHQTATAPVSVGLVHDPMRDAFRMFDKDGDSRISASELQSVLVSLGDRGHSMEECKKMIKSVDKDGDGYVDFMEFQELMGGQ